MADKRRRILDAALGLFAERGYHGTAVPEVAARAGVGAGTIYRYFESKEVLVNEVFRETKNHLKSHLLEEFDEGRPPKEMFLDIWGRLSVFAREHPVAFTFLEMQDHVPYLDPESKQTEMQVLAPIFFVAMRTGAKGILKPLPLEVIGAMVWGAFVGIQKAGRMGYIKRIDEKALRRAGEACWDAITK